MGHTRFVVIALARPRTSWFAQVAKWSNGASIPVEYLKCLGAHEVRARLASGRAVSAALIDVGAAGLDRDLVDELTDQGCAVIVVGDERSGRDWEQLGATAALPVDFGPAELMECLDENATAYDGGALVCSDVDEPPDPHAEGPGAWRGRLIAVCGGSGGGSSTVAMSVAQGLSQSAVNTDSVVLADLTNRGDLAMYHDARDVVPGLQELVESHRGVRPPALTVAQMLFDIDERGYRLLLGLRRRRDWTTLRSRALEAALDSLRRSARWVVCDIDADFDGEAETGSVDLEDRHLASRTAAGAADLVMVVGDASLKGTLDLIRVLGELRRFGVAPERVIPVVNRAPRSPRSRAEFTDAMVGLADGATVACPVFLPERRGLDDIHRHAARLPAALVTPVTRAVQAAAERLAQHSHTPDLEPERIVPGSLGIHRRAV